MPTDNDPNRPEIEEDGIRAEGLRRLRVRRMLDFSKRNLIGLQQERNLEGDDEMVVGKSEPAPKNAKWPFSEKKGQPSDAPAEPAKE